MALQMASTTLCTPAPSSFRSTLPPSYSVINRPPPRLLQLPTMPLSQLFGGSNSTAVTHLSIRPQNSVILYHGSAAEAAGQELKGKLIFCLSEAISVRRVYITLKGSYKIGLYGGTQANPTDVRLLFSSAENVFHEDSQTVYRSASPEPQDKLQPGNYEFDFHFILPGSLPESVDGMPWSWNAYQLRATMETKGRYAKDVRTQKRIRLVRTLTPNALEFSHNMSVGNVWVDKVNYHFSTSAKAVALGGTFTTSTKLIPLQKGIRPHKIFYKIEEVQKLSLTTRTKATPYRRTVYSHCNESLADVEATADADGIDCFVIDCTHTMPASLDECLQDVNIHGCLKVRHHIKFRVEISNPDGGFSAIKVFMPLQVYISPNVDMTEANLVVNPRPCAPSIASVEAPPTYHDRIFDPLFSGISTPPFQAHSGSSNTPSAVGSRSASSDNLSAMTSLAPSQNNEPDHATLLQRLRGLALTEASRTEGVQPRSSRLQTPGTPTSTGGSSVPRQQRMTSSAAEQREGRSASVGSNASFEVPESVHIAEYDIGALSRVPSYETALNSRANTEIQEGLPGYSSVA